MVDKNAECTAQVEKLKNGKSCVLPSRADRLREDAGKLTGFLNQSGLVTNTSVAKELEMVNAFIGLLEDRPELGLKFRP